MMVPVRCMTCGKPVAHLWEEYRKRVETGEDPGKVLDSLGLKRYCCRAVFLGTVEFSGEVSRFS